MCAAYGRVTGERDDAAVAEGDPHLDEIRVADIAVLDIGEVDGAYPVVDGVVGGHQPPVAHVVQERRGVFDGVRIRQL